MASEDHTATLRGQALFMFVMAMMFAIPLVGVVYTHHADGLISTQQAIHAGVAFTLIWYGMVFSPVVVRYLDDRYVAEWEGRANGE